MEALKTRKPENHSDRFSGRKSTFPRQLNTESGIPGSRVLAMDGGIESSI
jgi:hypothetical protein